MARVLKIYGWMSFRVEARVAGNTHGQTWEVVAAHSMAEVGRIVGAPARTLMNLGETGNKEDIAVALSLPGVVHWKPLNVHDAAYIADLQD